VERSNWNLWLERLLEVDLTGEELRLGVALAREILGWRKTEDKLGSRQLRERSRLHGRSFERAREGLVEKRRIEFEPGASGRGNAALYRLLLHPETSAETRAFDDEQNVRSGAEVSTDGNVRTAGAETSAQTSAETSAHVRTPIEPEGQGSSKESSLGVEQSSNGNGNGNGFHPKSPCCDAQLAEQGDGRLECVVCRKSYEVVGAGLLTEWDAPF
jgi:hypothetical protein